jgi:hypothetical protein
MNTISPTISSSRDLTNTPAQLHPHHRRITVRIMDIHLPTTVIPTAIMGTHTTGDRESRSTSDPATGGADITIAATMVAEDSTVAVFTVAGDLKRADSPGAALRAVDSIADLRAVVLADFPVAVTDPWVAAVLTAAEAGANEPNQN